MLPAAVVMPASGMTMMLRYLCMPMLRGATIMSMTNCVAVSDVTTVSTVTTVPGMSRMPAVSVHMAAVPAVMHCSAESGDQNE
jgi:hypothetical protein